MKDVSGRKMNQRFYDMLEENPVIAAVKDEEGLRNAAVWKTSRLSSSFLEISAVFRIL